MEHLKVKTLRGGVAKLCGQAGNFALRLGSMVVLARLLSPQDFGLVAMVTVVTGVYELFTSAGLSSATIQRFAITNQQISTLFWINILVGTALGALCVGTAPVLVKFYHEPRLFGVTIAMAAGFVLNAAGVQHSAILQRQLRYVAVTAIELSALLASIVVGIGMALAGFGYWSLVGAAIISPAVSTAGMWIVTGWIPGAPKWDAGVNSMLRFGGTITLNGLIVYIAYNFDKLLLGRVWGADALGIYGRAYQLINLPTGNLNAAVGGIAFSALSRLQNDPPRIRSYFLKGYSLVISMTVPITMFSAFFAEDIILVLLGPKWGEAAEIFRFLTPTVLIFGNHQSAGMVAVVGRLAGAEPAGCHGDRADRHRVLFDRAAIRPGWCRLRVFGRHDTLAHSACFVVPAWYGRFAERSVRRHDPSCSWRTCGGGIGLGCGARNWAISVANRAAAFRRRRDDDRLCGDPFIPVGTNEILFGSFLGIARSGSPARSLGKTR